MGLSQATLELLVRLKDEASAGLGSLGNAVGSLGMIAGGAALAGVVALGAAVVGGVSDAQGARALYAATEQTIQTMGNAAGRSAQEVVDLASSLSDAAGMSLFGDDQIQQSQNLLLTFGNIKGETFDLATALTVDLAQALGGAPKDQAMMLGKALNDPIKGITALGKAGLTFSEEQKTMIASMVEAGDMAGAQALIIKELNTQVGGQAAAAAQAAGGMVQFKAGLGETAETIGAALLPLLDQLGAWLVSPEVQGAIQTFATNFAAGIEIASAWLTGTFMPALAEVWAFLQANVLPILAEVVTWLATNIPPAIAATAEFITGTLIPALQEVWAFIDANVIPVIAILVDWLATNVPPAMEAVSSFITGTLVPAFNTVWAFVQDNIIPILSALATVAIALVKKEIELLSALWTGVLQPALNTVWSFIQDNVLPILSDLADFMGATLGPAIDTLGSTLGPVASWFSDIGSAVSGVINWLTDLAEVINSIEIPDWLEGHSPPPMANWLSAIAGAADQASAAVGGVVAPSLSPAITTAAQRSTAIGGDASATLGTTVRIVVEAGELKKMIKVAIEETMGASGQLAFNRMRTGN